MESQILDRPAELPVPSFILPWGKPPSPQGEEENSEGPDRVPDCFACEGVQIAATADRRRWCDGNGVDAPLREATIGQIGCPNRESPVWMWGARRFAYAPLCLWHQDAVGGVRARRGGTDGACRRSG